MLALAVQRKSRVQKKRTHIIFVVSHGCVCGSPKVVTVGGGEEQWSDGSGRARCRIVGSRDAEGAVNRARFGLRESSRDLAGGLACVD